MTELSTKTPLLLLSIIVSVTLAGNLHQPLRSEFYNELACPKEPVPLFEGKIRYLWLFAPATWYMPMASEKIYRQSAEVLLGRSARSQAELDLLDPRVRGFLSAPRFSGFGSKSFRKACFPINRPLKTFPKNLLEVTCFALWGTRGTDLTPATRATDSINWTDNENAVLITPCAGEDFNWLVLSKRPTISEEVKETVLQRISALGFSPAKAAYYDYENHKFAHNPIVFTTPIVHKSVPAPESEHEYGPTDPVSYEPQTPFYYSPQQSFALEPEYNSASSHMTPTNTYLMNYYYRK